MTQDLKNLGFSTNIIDCSKYQNTFELKKIIESGICAIIHKASEGDSADPDYVRRAKAFAQYSEQITTPLLWGAYCLLNPWSRYDGAQQAGVFFETITKLPTQSIVTVLDLEAVIGKKTGIEKMPSLQMIDQFMTRFLELMQKHYETVKLPMIFGNAAFLNEVFDHDNIRLAGYPVHQYPLWLARYNEYKHLEIPTAWRNSGFALWQYSDGKNGPEPKTVPGCANHAGHCDRSAYQGSIKALQNWWYENSSQLLPVSYQSKFISPSTSSTFFAPQMALEHVIKTLPNDNSLFDIDNCHNQGIRVLMSKATEGESVQKPAYKGRAQAVLQYNGINNDKILWAASHHFRKSSSSLPENQAKNFVNIISQVAIPTILVVEIVNYSNQIQTLEELTTFIKAVNKLLGQDQSFIIKGNPSHLDQVFSKASDCASFPLWIENYVASSASLNPTLPKAWSKAFIWEYASSCSRFNTQHLISTNLVQMAALACHSHILPDASKLSWGY